MARYGLGTWIASRRPTIFPAGTFTINVTGSFAIGFLLVFSMEKFQLDPAWRLFLVVGFLGSYTTFSTFEYETLKLLEEGRLLTAMLYVFSSVLAGLIAVWAGAVAGR